MTLGLAPRAAHVSQNWYNLAPAGRSGANNLSNLHSRHLSHTLVTFVDQYLDLCLSFTVALQQ